MELAKLRASQPKDSGGPSLSSSGGPASMPSFSSQESMAPSPGPTMDSVPAAPWSNNAMSDDGPAPLRPAATPKKSMILTKKKPGDIFGVPEPTPMAAEAVAEIAEPAAPAAYNPLLDPVKVDIDEQIKAKLEVEGGLSGEAEC